MKRPALAAIPLLCLVFLQPSSASSSLSLQERVQAQRVIDRLRFSHQVGTTRIFDVAVPPSATERRVLESLRESVALEAYWRTPITEEALRQELERIEARTLDPTRLRELYAALGNDEQLILEMVARPSLVERLTRNFYAFDERIHGEARREAQEIEAGLRSGAIDARTQHPRRRVMAVPPQDEELIGTAVQQSPVDVGQPGHADCVPRGAEEIKPGTVRPLREERGAFVVEVAPSTESKLASAISYVVPKRSWEIWWNEIEGRYPASKARAVPIRSSSAVRQPGLDRQASSEFRAKPSLSTCKPDDTWDTTPFESLPHSLAGHIAVWTGTEMIVWSDKRIGGFRYNPLTDTWRTMSTVGAPDSDPDPFVVAPWGLGKAMTAAVWTGSEMIVWRGFEATGARYDPQADVWKPMATEGAPSSRISYSTVWTGTEMIVWGGITSNSVQNNGARYDPVFDRWTPVSQAAAPAPRWGAAVMWTGTRVLVWGGVPSPQADGGGLYDPTTDSWTTMSTVGSVPGGQWPPAVWAGDQMLVVADSCSKKSRRYDPQTNTWNSIPAYRDPIWGCVGDIQARTWAGKELIIWESQEQRGARYDPSLNSWTFMSSTNGPTPRENHSVVWTGEHLIVWGGDAGSSGARYDPEADTWTPTATGSGPEDRVFHEAIWTGNEMIVWGGLRGGLYQYANGAARYDALTGQWKALPTNGAPVLGPILWTGEEAIVWTDPNVGGGRYDPISDSWRSMTTIDAPPQEANMATRWTGKELILWGGTFDPYHAPRDPLPVYPPDGGIYDPVRDTWSVTSTTGAPPGRLAHTAIWTGEELIVWGGLYCYAGYCGGDLGGGRYNPFTDEWKPMDFMSSGPVSAHPIEAVWTGHEIFYLHPNWQFMLKYNPAFDSWDTEEVPGFLWNYPVIWTGEEIVVAGGFTGARFNPKTGKWIQLTSNGTPLPRGWSSSVWTGNSMIVWGGQVFGPENSATKTGGVYYLGVDLDHDGFTACQGDCNDSEPAIGPDRMELPGDFVDENCDGVTACPPLISGRNGVRQFMQCMTATCGRIIRRDGGSSQQCLNRATQALQSLKCGDGRLRRPEVCDGSNLGGATCESLGFPGGTLSCNSSCNGYDTTGCDSTCGDGIVSGSERCDGTNMSGESCVSQGFDVGTLACSASCRNLDTSGCGASCGDGVVRGIEACDGDDFAGKTCASFGFDGGTLSCTSGCSRIDLSTCTTVCGDGVRRGLETCDGPDVAGMSCWWADPDVEYQGGTLACSKDCSVFDFRKCDVCGDGRRTGREECDRADLGGETCESLGYFGGTLRCNFNCGFTGCIPF